MQLFSETYRYLDFIYFFFDVTKIREDEKRTKEYKNNAMVPEFLKIRLTHVLYLGNIFDCISLTISQTKSIKKPTKYTYLLFFKKHVTFNKDATMIVLLRI